MKDQKTKIIVNEHETIIPIIEQETGIIFDYQDKNVFLYSSKSSMIKKMKKWQQEYPEEAKFNFENICGMEITIPEKWVRVRPPKKVSEDWKEEARIRLEEARNKRGKE